MYVALHCLLNLYRIKTVRFVAVVPLSTTPTLCRFSSSVSRAVSYCRLFLASEQVQHVHVHVYIHTMYTKWIARFFRFVVVHVLVVASNDSFVKFCVSDVFLHILLYICNCACVDLYCTSTVVLLS